MATSVVTITSQTPFAAGSTVSGSATYSGGDKKIIKVDLLLIRVELAEDKHVFMLSKSEQKLPKPGASATFPFSLQLPANSPSSFYHRFESKVFTITYLVCIYANDKLIAKSPLAVDGWMNWLKLEDTTKSQFKVTVPGEVESYLTLSSLQLVYPTEEENCEVNVHKQLHPLLVRPVPSFCQKICGKAQPARPHPGPYFSRIKMALWVAFWRKQDGNPITPIGMFRLSTYKRKYWDEASDFSLPLPNKHTLCTSIGSTLAARYFVGAQARPFTKQQVPLNALRGEHEVIVARRNNGICPKGRPTKASPATKSKGKEDAKAEKLKDSKLKNSSAKEKEELDAKDKDKKGKKGQVAPVSEPITVGGEDPDSQALVKQVAPNMVPMRNFMSCFTPQDHLMEQCRAMGFDLGLGIVDPASADGGEWAVGGDQEFPEDFEMPDCQNPEEWVYDPPEDEFLPEEMSTDQTPVDNDNGGMDSGEEVEEEPPAKAKKPPSEEITFGKPKKAILGNSKVNEKEDWKVGNDIEKEKGKVLTKKIIDNPSSFKNDSDYKPAKEDKTGKKSGEKESKEKDYKEKDHKEKDNKDKDAKKEDPKKEEKRKEESKKDQIDPKKKDKSPFVADFQFEEDDMKPSKLRKEKHDIPFDNEKAKKSKNR